MIAVISYVREQTYVLRTHGAQKHVKEHAQGDDKSLVLAPAPAAVRCLLVFLIHAFSWQAASRIDILLRQSILG